MPSTTPLRIALLSYRSAPHSGGQGVYVRCLSKALCALGHQVDVISGPPYPELDSGPRLIKLPGLDLYANGLASLRPHHLRSWNNIVEWLSKLTGGFSEPYVFGQRVYRYMRGKGLDSYDVVHDNQCLSPGVARLHCAERPLVTTIHHPVTRDFRLKLAAAPDWKSRQLVRRWHSFLRMQMRVVRQLQHVFTVSLAAREAISEDFCIPESAIDVVYNGIDSECFSPRPDLQRKSWRLITTASADEPLKGLVYLIEAFASLLPRYPQLTLVVIGKLRSNGACAEKIAALGLAGDSRLSFRSGLSNAELAKCYAESTIAISPSLYEGFGFPAGEAMASGTATIVTDGGALPEVAGDAALVVRRGSSEELAAAITKLLADKALRVRLGRESRQRIEEKFKWQDAAEATVALYRQAMVASA